MTNDNQTPGSKKVSNRLIAVGLALVAIAAYAGIALRIKYGTP
jgi:hypothetical protein